jgi:ubiquinone/menaquinone biosynthesis C-methylase UbiE
MCSLLTDKEWATRHIFEGEGWIEGYWKSRDHPHRSFLIEKICKYSPIRSILEIGCASGPNLYLIAEKLPNAEIRGVEINPMAVQKGNEWFRRKGISNVKLEVGKAQELSRFSDKSFDVVFTDAVLIYISPDEIKKVIKEMLRIGRVIVLFEWHSFNKWFASLLHVYHFFRLKIGKYILPRQRFRTAISSFKPKSASLGLFVGHWVRDYKTLFEEFVQKERIRITKLPKELWNDRGWQRWGAIIEITP